MNIQELSSQFHIDKNIPVPLYYQFKQGLKNLIQDGTFQVNEQIPTENEFCEALGISRPTVRQALKELIQEGLLTRRKPLGTFVCAPKIDSYFFEQLASFNDEMRMIGLTPSTNVLSKETIVAAKDITDALQLPNNAKVLHLKRLRFANNEPMVVLDTYLPSSLFPTLEQEDFITNSLYALLEQKYNCSIQSVNRTIEATLADDSTAKLLSIPKKSAVCMCTTVSYNQQETPIEYSIALYRGDRHKFSLKLVKK